MQAVPLPEFIEYIKSYENGILLSKTVEIFYEDWSKNPTYEDDYSERVYLYHGKLTTCQVDSAANYKVTSWELDVYVPSLISVHCNKIKK